MVIYRHYSIQKNLEKMTLLTLSSASDVQNQLSKTIQKKRKAMKLSRDELALRSTVPASTIKRFETTGQISLRQFILLWQSVDDLTALIGLTKEQPTAPKTIEEVLRT